MYCSSLSAARCTQTMPVRISSELTDSYNLTPPSLPPLQVWQRSWVASSQVISGVKNHLHWYRLENFTSVVTSTWRFLANCGWWESALLRAILSASKARDVWQQSCRGSLVGWMTRHRPDEGPSKLSSSGRPPPILCSLHPHFQLFLGSTPCQLSCWATGVSTDTESGWASSFPLDPRCFGSADPAL